MAIAEVKRLHAVGGVHTPDRERERLRREGQEIEREMLEKVPVDQREMFRKLIIGAQAAQYFSEDHDYWCEFISHSLIRRAYMEIGRRFVKAGTLDDPEDLNYFDPYEIAWASMVPERIDMRPKANRNKEEWNSYYALLPIPSDEVPVCFGDMSRVGEMIAADESVSVALGSPVGTAEEMGALCVGAAGSPGVVEGIARVIMSEDDWDQVQPGEILVTQMTSATWTPLFGIIKAVVTAFGGAMAHAAIVSREYWIPGVCGTMDGTRKIKTGDRIRVDGNRVAVYRLQ